jgi:hypothetical protein
VSTLYSKSLGTGWASNTHNVRTLLQAADISANGTRIRVQFKAHGSSDITLSGVSIGERSGTSANFTGTPTRLTFSSSNSVTITAGNTAWSDWVNFALDEAKDYLVHMNTDQGAGSFYFASATDSGNKSYYTYGGGDSVDSTMDATLGSNFGDASFIGVTQVDQSEPSARVSQAAAEVLRIATGSGVKARVSQGAVESLRTATGVGVKARVSQGAIEILRLNGEETPLMSNQPSVVIMT